MANKKTKIQMEWRLSALMGERRIRTATDLQRRLNEVGVSISSAQLARLINGNPARLSSNLMYGLTLVLDCEACDLWRNPDRSIPHERERAERIAHTPKLAWRRRSTPRKTRGIAKGNTHQMDPRSPVPRKEMGDDDSPSHRSHPHGLRPLSRGCPKAHAAIFMVLLAGLQEGAV